MGKNVIFCVCFNDDETECALVFSGHFQFQLTFAWLVCWEVNEFAGVIDNGYLDECLISVAISGQNVQWILLFQRFLVLYLADIQLTWVVDEEFSSSIFLENARFWYGQKNYNYW